MWVTNDDQNENKAVVAAHFAALNSGEYEQLSRLHSASGRNHAPGPFDLSEWPADGVPFGAPEVQGTFEWLRAAVPDLQAEVEVLVAEADQVVAWVRVSGTQAGPLGAAPGGGRMVDFYHAHRFRLVGGQIVEHWAVRDDLRAMLQSGVVRPPGGPTESQ